MISHYITVLSIDVRPPVGLLDHEDGRQRGEAGGQQGVVHPPGADTCTERPSVMTPVTQMLTLLYCHLGSGTGQSRGQREC